MTDTPETDACYARAGMMLEAQHDELDACCRKLERQRDLLKGIAVKNKEHYQESQTNFSLLDKKYGDLERERDQWKAAHDNQVKLKQIISDRPDMKERAKLVAELIAERDEARFDLAFRLERNDVQQLQLSGLRKKLARTLKHND